MRFLVFLFLFSCPAFAQRAALVTPTGDTVQLTRLTPRTVYVHDTTRLILHDTVTEKLMVSQTYERLIEPVYIAVSVPKPDTVFVKEKKNAVRFGIFGYGAFRADAIGPAVLFDMGNFELYLFGGMSYYGPADNRRTVGEAGVAGFVTF